MAEVVDIAPVHLTNRQRMGLLFQARMWRVYAKACRGDYFDRLWMAKVIRADREVCLDRAREALRKLQNDR